MEASVKKAAIKLKGIDAADRKWVLKRLNKRELAILLPVLNELDEISYTQIFDLESALGKECPRNTDGEASEGVVEKSRRLERYSELTIKTVLEGTSDPFLCLLIDSEIDVEDDGLLAYIGTGRRRKIAAMVDRRKRKLTKQEISQVEEFLIQKLEQVEYGRDL